MSRTDELRHFTTHVLDTMHGRRAKDRVLEAEPGAVASLPAGVLAEARYILGPLAQKRFANDGLGLSTHSRPARY